MNTKAIAIGLAAAVVAAVVFFVVLPEKDPAGESKSASQNDTAAFAKSLSGTTPDGVLQDVGGELVLDEGLIERFDYYLTTMGERTLAEIREEVARSLDKELKPKAAAEAKRLFGRYLDFKDALRSMTPEPATGSAIDTVRARRTAILALRSRFFSPAEVTALFGKNDLLENDSFARMDIEKNPSLSAAQKKAQLAELDARLPASVREGRAPDAKHHGLVAAEAEAKARGATEAQLLQIRTELVGAEAAQNLAAFDKEEAAWKQRIDTYLAERNRLLAFAGMVEADRQAEVNKLRERSFSVQERLRLGAYE